MILNRAQFQAWGAIGGRIRAQRLSKAKRKQIAKQAVAARDKKRKSNYIPTGLPRGLPSKVNTADATKLYKAGKTLQEIGTHFGVSRERIRQIMEEENEVSAQENRAMRALLRTPIKLARKKKKEDATERRCLKAWGMSKEQYFEIEKRYGHNGAAGSPLTQYAQQQSTAKMRSIAWKLTFPEWWKIWQDSGHYSERGRGGNRYAMCRFGDTGAYKVGNVEIITNAQNAADQWISGKKRKPLSKKRIA